MDRHLFIIKSNGEAQKKVGYKNDEAALHYTFIWTED